AARGAVARRLDVHVGHCAGCGRRVQGRHPLQTSDALGAAASQLGPDAHAAIAVLNKDLGLPHGKVARLFGTLFGVALTRGACAQVVLRAAGRLEPADQEICRELRASGRLVPDETGWRVGGAGAWLHAWVAPRVTCYAVEADRSAEALEAVIGRGWSGAMPHDGFASYGRFEAATHQQCRGHVLRRARELAAQAARGAVHSPRRLIALLSEAIHLRNRHLRGEVPAAALRAARGAVDARLPRLGWPAAGVAGA